MKNRKICPKCNSTDIIKVPGKAGAYGVGNNIQTGWSNFSAVLFGAFAAFKFLAGIYLGAGGFWGFCLSLWLLRRCRDIVRLVLSPGVVLVRFLLRLFY